MTDLFSIAKQMADNIPEDEKKKMQNMKMEDMVSSVAQNVMTMMQSGNFPFQPPPQQQQTSVENTSKPVESKIDLSDTPEKIDNNEFTFPDGSRFADYEDVEFTDDEDDVISPKTNDLHYTLNVKLEDLYNGKQKKISFKRKRFKKVKDDKGREKYETFFEKKKIFIHIAPGMRDGQTIVFNKEADQLPGHEPGDVIITICEMEHDIFDRDGDNLFLIKDISLSEIYKLEQSFTHLDKRIITIKSKEGDILHTKDGVRKIVGEGMPVYNNDPKKDNIYGDLFIRFNLMLPEKLDEEKLNSLVGIAPPLTSTLEGAEYTKILEEVTEEDMEKFEDDYSDSEDESEDDDEEEEEEDDDEEEEDEVDDEEEDEEMEEEKEETKEETSE